MLEFFGAMYLGLAGFFVFGSMFFWIALLALSSLIFWFDDKEAPVMGTITVVATIFLFNVSGILPITGPTSFVVGVILYLGLGVAWSFAKWYSFLSNKKEKLLEFKAQFIEDYNKGKVNAEGTYSDNFDLSRQLGVDKSSLTPISPDVSVQLPVELREPFTKYLKRAGYFGDRYSSQYDLDQSIIPSASNNKARIMGWMTYWPWSALWTLIHDPIRKAVKALWRHLATSYQRLADKAFSGVTDDFK